MKLFKKIFVAFILFMVGIQISFAETILTTKSNNNSTINITNTQPCYLDGVVQPGTHLAYLISSNDGKVSSGCWVVNIEDKTILVNWGNPGIYAYAIAGFNVTSFGRVYLNLDK